MSHNPLGQNTVYPDTYSPSLLFAIERKLARQNLPFFNQANTKESAKEIALPFTGVDRWTAFELSWLNDKGKPCVRLAEIVIPAFSPCIIESKSLKLYLNSLNQHIFSDENSVLNTLKHDISQMIQASVEVSLHHLDVNDVSAINALPGQCIDELEIDVEAYSPNASLLQLSHQKKSVNECLYSHLLKTNCPITGQPDWATVFIEYTGQQIDAASLLSYIVSYRQHQDYHEHCIEQMFCDIKTMCQPENLTVYGRYTRRGGLDINPLRTDYSEGQSRLNSKVLRTARQ